MNKCVVLLKENEIVSMVKCGEINNSDIVDFWMEMTEQVLMNAHRDDEENLANSMHRVIELYRGTSNED